MIRGFQWVAAAAIVGGSIIYLSNNILSDRDQRQTRLADTEAVQSPGERSPESIGRLANSAGNLGSQSRQRTISADDCTGTASEIIACEQAAAGIAGREAPFGVLGTGTDPDGTASGSFAPDNPGNADLALADTVEQRGAAVSANSPPGNDADTPDSAGNTPARNGIAPRPDPEAAAPGAAGPGDEAVSFPGAPAAQGAAVTPASPDTKNLAPEPNAGSGIADKISNDVTLNNAQSNDATSNNNQSNDVRSASAAISSNWGADGQKDQELAVIELKTDEDGRITSGKRVRKQLVNGRLVDKPDDSAFFTENKPLEAAAPRAAGTTKISQPGKALVDKLDDSNFFTENQRLDPCLREDGSVYTGPGTAQDPLALENPCLPISVAEESIPEFTDPCLAGDFRSGGFGSDGTFGETAPNVRIFPDGEDPCLTRQYFAVAAPDVLAPLPLETPDTVVEPEPLPERFAFDTPPEEVRVPFPTDTPRRPPRLVPPFNGASYRVDG